MRTSKVFPLKNHIEKINMIPLFLIVFVLCLLYNYVVDGGTFIVFSRFVEMTNNLRERTPRNVRIMDKIIVHELKIGNRLFAVLIPKRAPFPWVRSAALIDGNWEDITKEIEYYAGPFRNFYDIPITPSLINSGFEKLGFQFQNGNIVYVEPNEIICKKLKLSLTNATSK